MHYYVYILECADKTLYIGLTTDIERRVEEHNTSDKGAKYTKNRRPVIFKYSETFKTRSEALKREYEMKQLTRVQKLALIEKK